MSLEFYRFLHFICIVIVTSCLGINYFAKPGQKLAKIVGMTASLLLLVAGMGLIAKTMHGEPWPSWVKMKIVLWTIIAISGPIMAKRLKSARGWAFSFLMLLFIVAISLAVFKPTF